MLRLALFVALALPLAAAGCAPTAPASAPAGDGARVSRPDAGEPFRLPLGQTATRDGHTVRFAEIVEDSRCPTGVQCVRAGEARIRLEIDGTSVVLAVPYANQPDDDPSMIELGEIQVVVTGLEPYPREGAPATTPEAVLITRPATV